MPLVLYAYLLNHIPLYFLAFLRGQGVVLVCFFA